MCNFEISKNRWFFGAIDPTCGMKSLGPWSCDFWHFMKFRVDTDGKRNYRNNFGYKFLAIICCILYLPLLILYLFIMSFVWAIRAT